MSRRSEFDEVKTRIDEIISRLDDLTFDILKEAAREFGTRPAADKTLVQARRALEKASRLLYSVASDEPDESDD